MAHRDGLAVDRVRRRGARPAGREVRDDLVAMEVEVDPVRRGAALGAAEHAAVESPCLGEVADGEGEVEARTVHGQAA